MIIHDITRLIVLLAFNMLIFIKARKFEMKTEQRKRAFQAIILSAATAALLLSAFCWRTKEQTIDKPDSALPDEEMREDAFGLSEVLGSCVRIQAEGHHGSGSIYRLLEDEIIIVTNWHVLQYWNEDSYVTFFNGAGGSGKVMDI